MPHARRAPSNHENGQRCQAKVTVTKPVSFSVQRLRELLEPNNVTE
jgi:hypothetical protein